MQIVKPKFIIAGFGLCCALLAFASSFAFPPTYVSTMTLLLRDQPDQPERTKNMQLSQRINRIAQQALTRASLTEIVNKRNLYKQQREELPLEDVIEHMRAKDIRISNVVGFNSGSQSRPAFQLSFAAQDGYTAELVTRDIAAKLNEAQERLAPETRLEILDAANIPLRPVFPARQNFALAGLLAGLSIGSLCVWYRSRRVAG